MTIFDDLELPRDPGTVPASLRDAYARARDAERSSHAQALPDDTALDAFAGMQGDEDAQLGVVDQLLGSAEGAGVLAHIVAARTSVHQSENLLAAKAAAAPRHLLGNQVTPLQTARQSRGGFGSSLKPVLLAASLMLVAGTSWYGLTRPSRGDELRSADATLTLDRVAPSQSNGAITLRWRAIRDDVRYRVEVLDTADEPVYATETNETSAIVPPSALKPGTYRWYVRARATDGTEMRSRVDSFIVR